MEIYNGVTCVPAVELVEKGLTTWRGYYLLSARGRIRVVRRGCRCTPALVEYDTLPWRMKEELQRVYGDPRRAAERSTFVDGVEIDGEAVKFFAEWEFVDKESGQTTRLKADKQREYVNNASVIRALLRTHRDMQQARRTGGRGVSGFWDKAVVWAEEAMDRYPHSLPSNPRRLKDKCESFVQEADRRFARWLDENLEKNPLKCEYYLPTVVTEALETGKAEVKVLTTPDKWHGITYREDKPELVAALAAMHASGFYPKERLF